MHLVHSRLKTTLNAFAPSDWFSLCSFSSILTCEQFLTSAYFEAKKMLKIYIFVLRFFKLKANIIFENKATNMIASQRSSYYQQLSYQACGFF